MQCNPNPKESERHSSRQSHVAMQTHLNCFQYISRPLYVFQRPIHSISRPIRWASRSTRISNAVEVTLSEGTGRGIYPHHLHRVHTSVRRHIFFAPPKTLRWCVACKSAGGAKWYLWGRRCDERKAASPSYSLEMAAGTLTSFQNDVVVPHAGNHFCPRICDSQGSDTRLRWVTFQLSTRTPFDIL